MENVKYSEDVSPDVSHRVQCKDVVEATRYVVDRADKAAAIEYVRTHATTSDL